MTVSDPDAALVTRLTEYVRRILNLPADAPLDPDVSLAEQTDLDSIEAFNAVATLHEILDVEIPDDFDPGAMTTIRGLAAYITAKYPPQAVARLYAADFDRLTAEYGGL